MTISPFKRPRIQLDPKDYARLCWQVLRRDGWGCQVCGKRANLQVHHLKPRSQSGDDVEKNLITLCSTCHDQVHGTI